MKYKLLEQYFLDQNDDRITWIRIFEKERKMLAGHGVYRDDVLILLSPTESHNIKSVAGVRSELGFDELPIWDKTRYLIHMGNIAHNYSVDEAIHCPTGEAVRGEELKELVKRIEDVF